MYLDKFAKRLCDLMEMERVSQRKLSLKINVDRKSVRLWMQGENFPRYSALIRLAEYFNVRIDFLLGLEDAICDTAKGFSAVDEQLLQQRFYTCLTEYMAREKLTIYALSKRLEIDQKAVTHWLTKGSMPEVSTMIKLAQFMDISLQELLIGNR